MCVNSDSSHTPIVPAFKLVPFSCFRYHSVEDEGKIAVAWLLSSRMQAELHGDSYCLVGTITVIADMP